MLNVVTSGNENQVEVKISIVKEDRFSLNVGHCGICGKTVMLSISIVVSVCRGTPADLLPRSLSRVFKREMHCDDARDGCHEVGLMGRPAMYIELSHFNFENLVGVEFKDLC